MMSSPLKFPQPTLPFKREISHPGVGTSVQIRGHPFEDKIKSFTVAIDTDRDTAINLSCRVGNKGEIIATASIGGSVTSEVTKPCSLSPRKMLKLVITANEHVFEVFLNDVFILDFVHRVNPLDYKYLTINGPIICEEVLLTPGQMPSSMSDPLPPPPTYEASLIAPSRELNQIDRDMQRMNVSGPGNPYPPSQPPAGPGYPPQAPGQTQGFNKLPYAYDQQPANQNPTNPFQQGYQQAPAGTVRPEQSYSNASTVPVSGGSISDKRKLFEKEGLAEKIRQQAQAPNSSPIRTGTSSSSPYAPMPQPGLSQPAANYPQYSNTVPQTTGAQPYPSGQPGYVSSSQRASPPFPNPPAPRELPYANVRQGGPAPGINVIPSTPLGTTGGPGYPPSGPGSFQAGGPGSLRHGSSPDYKGSQSGVSRGGSPQGYPMPQPAPMNMPTPYSGGSPGQSPYGSSPQNTNPYPGGGPMNQYVPQPTNSYPSGGPTNQYAPGPTNSYPSGDPTNQYAPGPTNSYPSGDPTNQYVPQPANSYPGGGQHVNQYVSRPITPPSPQNASYNPGTNYYPGPGGPTNVQNSVMGAVSYQGHGGGQYYTGGFDQPTYVAGVPTPQVVHTTSYTGCQTRCRSYSSCSD